MRFRSKTSPVVALIALALNLSSTAAQQPRPQDSVDEVRIGVLGGRLYNWRSGVRMLSAVDQGGVEGRMKGPGTSIGLQYVVKLNVLRIIPRVSLETWHQAGERRGLFVKSRFHRYGDAPYSFFDSIAAVDVRMRKKYSMIAVAAIGAVKL